MDLLQLFFRRKAKVNLVIRDLLAEERESCKLGLLRQLQLYVLHQFFDLLLFLLDLFACRHRFRILDARLNVFQMKLPVCSV